MYSRNFGYSSSGNNAGNGYYSSSNGFFSQPAQPAYCPPPAQQITTSHGHGFFNPHYHQSNCAPDPFHDHHHGHHGWKHW